MGATSTGPSPFPDEQEDSVLRRRTWAERAAVGPGPEGGWPCSLGLREH